MYFWVVRYQTKDGRVLLEQRSDIIALPVPSTRDTSITINGIYFERVTHVHWDIDENRSWVFVTVQEVK